MAITRERKEDLIAHYTEILQNSEGFIVTEYRGMQMPGFNDIRSELRKANASYVVTKNRLFKIALNSLGLPIPDDLLTGPVAVSIAHADLPNMVKALLAKQKDHERLILKGGVVGNSIFGEKDLKTLSELPTMDQIRAQLVGILVQPMQGLVTVLNAPPQNLVSVLDAGANSLANVLAAYAQKQGSAA
jgi:large subunit ribosomal protein L10